MASQIILQPDGKFAGFSSVVDGFVFYDATEEEIIEIEVEAYRERVLNRVTEICQLLRNGERPHNQFHLSYDEALAMHIENHGELK